MTQAELRDFMAEHFDTLTWNRDRKLFPQPVQETLVAQDDRAIHHCAATQWIDEAGLLPYKEAG